MLTVENMSDRPILTGM